ncbi:unnamed protein product [Candidula unifasciata]|uniref:Uncharacterized protein n=1 Tax=Candidula unifasciata TaxID=100452 RepID=A0A8S3Z895_9EUPU|nr:unnamed protein product [Candidula unifasciata]
MKSVCQVIDTEAKLVALINNLREDTQTDMLLVEFLTRFWQEIKAATQDLQVLLDKFGCTVLHRISSNYTHGQIFQLQVPLCQTYTSDIEHFSKDLEKQLTNAQLLLKNYGYSVNSDMIDRSSFKDRLMVCCDLKAFPILGFVSDIASKITRMCDTARQWLARDEQFMHEINEFIREIRTAARKREEIFHLKKTEQKNVERNAKVAHNIMLSNRQKLRLIDAELQELERRLGMCREEQQARMVEIHQKESMMDFLRVTLQQTKKNCRLQTKRAKLHKQVKELGDYVRVMEADLELVQDQILAKSHEKIILTEKIHTSEKSYGVLKTDLDKFSENLEDMEAEVSDLSGQLLQLEIVHTIRTSPEILDNLTDRPTSVKLSKSLKERIKQKHRKYLTLN